MQLPPKRDDPEWNILREHDIEELWDHSRRPHVAASHAARMDLLSDLVTGVTPPSGRILDVGCAQGTLGLRLAERGFRVSLLDVRERFIDYAKERGGLGDLRYYVGRLGPESPPDRNYDVVVCTEVLEHVPAPALLLNGLAQKARAGGTVVLTTPNAEYLRSRWPTFGTVAQEVIDHAERDSADGDAHRFLFTGGELTSLVRGVGMRVERAGYFLPFWLEGHLKTRYLHALHYRVRGRILRPRAQLPRGLARYLCASQWLVARLPSRGVDD